MMWLRENIDVVGWGGREDRGAIVEIPRHEEVGRGLVDRGVVWGDGEEGALFSGQRCRPCLALGCGGGEDKASNYVLPVFISSL